VHVVVVGSECGATRNYLVFEEFFCCCFSAWEVLYINVGKFFYFPNSKYLYCKSPALGEIHQSTTKPLRTRPQPHTQLQGAQKYGVCVVFTVMGNMW
jgi:hypothetical protein